MSSILLFGKLLVMFCMGLSSSGHVSAVEVEVALKDTYGSKSV